MNSDRLARFSGCFNWRSGSLTCRQALHAGQEGSRRTVHGLDHDIEGKLVERNEARKQKNFKKADEIRQFLASHGIVIEDKPDGTSRWKR